MRLACKYCRKVFSSGAALNFHTKKLHQKELSESAPSTSSSSGPQSEKSNAKPPLCPMIKFGRIRDVPDPLAGPFKPFSFCKPDLVAATKTTEKPSTSKSKIKVENKADDVGDGDDEDIVEILQDRQPQPSSSAAVFNFETPATSSQTRQKKRKGKKGGEIKRRRLSEEYSSSNSDSSAPGKTVEREISGYQSLPITVSSVAKEPILTRSSLSSTDGDDDASVAGSSVSVSTTSSRRGRKPTGRTAIRVDGKIQPCPICGMAEFRNDNHYKNHVEIHEGKRPFVCPQCGRGYETDIKLLEHVSCRHLNEPAFECAKCGNSYKIRRAFQNHKCSPTKGTKVRGKEER